MTVIQEKQRGFALWSRAFVTEPGDPVRGSVLQLHLPIAVAVVQGKASTGPPENSMSVT